jgi:predicted transcriptional regulator
LKQKIKALETRRDHLQILVEILELCKAPNPKTQILHNVNTNFRLLESYLLQLKAAQLIEKDPTTNKYTTTRKGLKFNKNWKALRAMMEPRQIALTVKTRKYVVNHKKLIVVSN